MASDRDVDIPSALESFETLARDLAATVDTVLDRSAIVYDDPNDPGSPLVFIGFNPWRWAPLERADQRLLKDAHELARRWQALTALAVRVGDERRLEALQLPWTAVEDVLDRSDRSGGAPASDIDAVRARVRVALDEQLEVIRDLPTAQGDGERLLVPDTVAFLRRPDIETWSLDGAWTVVAVPQVIRELDEKKLDPRLSDKADKVIRRFKEYGRRGDTFRGVKLAGRLSFREVPVEADMNATLPWLRSDVGDDRALASILELRFGDLASAVALVTEDRNMQNKARVAALPYLDVDAL